MCVKPSVWADCGQLWREQCLQGCIHGTKEMPVTEARGEEMVA